MTSAHRRLAAATAALLVGGAMAGCSSAGSSGPRPERMTPASPSTVERDEMEDAPSSIEDLIRGRFPNVYIERNGSRLTLRIRGVSTFSGGTNALVVIDGVAHDTPDVLLDVNPADVVRIQVLKDAAAAIYGVRGQNGVLVVTTRRTG